MMGGIRRETSAEIAARFLARRGDSRGPRKAHTEPSRPAPQPQSYYYDPSRIVLNLARATFAEILDCVLARVQHYANKGEPLPHATRIALAMLNEALEVRR